MFSAFDETYSTQNDLPTGLFPVEHAFSHSNITTSLSKVNILEKYSYKMLDFFESIPLSKLFRYISISNVTEYISILEK